MGTKPNGDASEAPQAEGASPPSPASPSASAGPLTSAKSGTVVMQAIHMPTVVPAHPPSSVSPVVSTVAAPPVADPRATGPTQLSALPMMPCPTCGVSTPVAKYCTDCGALMQTKKFCSDCGLQLKATAKFCESCGAKVG